MAKQNATVTHAVTRGELIHLIANPLVFGSGSLARTAGVVLDQPSRDILHSEAVSRRGCVWKTKNKIEKFFFFFFFLVDADTNSLSLLVLILG